MIARVTLGEKRKLFFGRSLIAGSPVATNNAIVGDLSFLPANTVDTGKATNQNLRMGGFDSNGSNDGVIVTSSTPGWNGTTGNDIGLTGTQPVNGSIDFFASKVQSGSHFFLGVAKYKVVSTAHTGDDVIQFVTNPAVPGSLSPRWAEDSEINPATLTPAPNRNGFDNTSEITSTGLLYRARAGMRHL